MKAQICLDSEDILRQLQQYIAMYANVLNPYQCEKLADAMQVLMSKSK